MKKVFILLIFPVILASCEKEVLFENQSCTSNCFFIKGAVFNKDTWEKLPNAEIRAYLPGGYLQRDIELVNTKTDENGEFLIRIPAYEFLSKFPDKSIFLESRKPGYIYHYTRDSQISSFQVDSTLVDSTLQENVELVERAELTVKLNIFSVTPRLQRVSIIFKNQLLGTYKSTFLGPGIINEEKTFQVAGNQSTEIEFRLFFEGGSQKILDDSKVIYLESGETKEIQAKYITK